MLKKLFRRKYENSMQYVYKQNKKTGAALVEIRLDDYDEMFRGWDASPAAHREMHPELLRFMEESGFEIDYKRPIEFCFFVEKDNLDKEKESLSKEAIRNNFKMAVFRADKTLNKNRRRMMAYVFFSILFLIASFIMTEAASPHILSQIFIQGLFVGGWVLLWEAFSIFFFTSHEIRQRRKRYVKFLDSDVYFKYAEDIMPSI